MTTEQEKTPMGEAMRKIREEGRQHHAEHAKQAQLIRKIYAPLNDLLRKDEQALHAAHDLLSMRSKHAAHKPKVPTAPVQLPFLPFPFIEGSKILFFTPSSYVDPSSDGAGSYAKVTAGTFGFNMMSLGQGFLDATAGLGVAMYHAQAGDYQIRFSPFVQYDYNWYSSSFYYVPTYTVGNVFLLINSVDVNGQDFRQEYNGKIGVFGESIVASYGSEVSGNGGGYLNDPQTGGTGIQIYLDITASRSYYFAITCYGGVEADGPSLATAQLDIIVPFVVLEVSYKI